jgi:hypothetical protein
MPKSKHWKYDSYCEYRNKRRVATSRTERISDKTFQERIKKCQEAFEKDVFADTYKSNMADSFLQQNDSGNGLTRPQIETLKRWEEWLSDSEKWSDTYRKSPKKKELFSLATRYFAEAGYYTRAIRSYTEDPEGYIPPRSLYDRMIENTYFQRWLPEVKKAPRFVVGDIVEGRAGNYEHASAMYLITSVSDTIDPCKGGRWYKGHVIRDTERYSWKNTAYAKTHGGLRRFRERDVKICKVKKRAEGK